MELDLSNAVAAAAVETLVHFASLGTELLSWEHLLAYSEHPKVVAVAVVVAVVDVLLRLLGLLEHHRTGYHTMIPACGPANQVFPQLR